MASKVFISFRFNDGNDYKEKLEKKFKELDYTINKSESIDRSNHTDETIKKYLYEKLADSSITIVILTPNALEYQVNSLDKIGDWLYDELRYSLEDRSGNRTNAVIALYVDEVKNKLYSQSSHNGCSACGYKKSSNVQTVKDFYNLVRKICSTSRTITRLTTAKGFTIH